MSDNEGFFDESDGNTIWDESMNYDDFDDVIDDDDYFEDDEFVPVWGFIAAYEDDDTPDLSEKQEFIEATAKVMSDKSPLTVQTNICDAWLLVSALQLATRHPGLHDPMKERLTTIAHLFEGAIVALHPEALELLNAGWNPVFDVE